MDRLAIPLAGLALLVLALVLVLCLRAERTPSADAALHHAAIAHPVEPAATTAAAHPEPLPRPSSTTASAVASSESATATTPTGSEAVAQPAAAKTADAVLRGSSPIPTGGKIVAPVDAVWEILRDGERFHGTITLTPRAGPARLIATSTARNGAVLDGPLALDVPAAVRDVAIACPIAGRITAGSRGASLVIEVRAVSSDTRGRAFTIALQDTADAESATTPATGNGVRIVTDDSGGRTVLMPSTSRPFGQPPATGPK